MNQLRPVATRSWFTDLALVPKKTNQGIGGMVFTTGEAYYASDFATDPNTRSNVRDQIPPGWGGACIPIYSSAERVGIFLIAFPPPRQMKKEETHLLLNLAEIAGNAIHRMRLHAQAELHVQRLNALRLFDMAITTSLDLRLTLDVLLEQATTQLGVDAADVLLFNDTTKMLEYAAGRGFRTGTVMRSRIRMGEGLAGKAARERKILHIDEPSLVAGSSAQGWMVLGEKFKSYYGVPLISKGNIEGVLELFHRDHLSPDMEWLGFLETLAGQAAIAIDDAQLFENLQRSNAELMLAYDIFIEGLSRTLELRHLETQGHSQRVTDLTINLARDMHVFNDETLIAIRRGAILHDIGKICVPDSILLKPGKLDTDEWVVMRKHPDYANDMLAPIGYLGAAVDIPYCHHEKWDGSGYPRGLIGEQIPLSARIFAVIDVYDALTNDRVYNNAWPFEKVREHILSQSGTHFDPQVVTQFISYIDSGKIDHGQSKNQPANEW
ncbi:MAG: GAF domain-containing protein [Anaerolineaceae bacterium]|nr:GAF domain-containing protein [Anaerolineaceae bacterium]